MIMSHSGIHLQAFVLKTFAGYNLFIQSPLKETKLFHTYFIYYLIVLKLSLPKVTVIAFSLFVSFTINTRNWKNIFKNPDEYNSNAEYRLCPFELEYSLPKLISRVFYIYKNVFTLGYS